MPGANPWVAAAAATDACESLGSSSGRLIPRPVLRTKLAANSSIPMTTTETTIATGFRVTPRTIAPRQPSTTGSAVGGAAAPSASTGTGPEEEAGAAATSARFGIVGQNSARPNIAISDGTNVTDTSSP